MSQQLNLFDFANTSRGTQATKHASTGHSGG